MFKKNYFRIFISLLLVILLCCSNVYATNTKEANLDNGNIISNSSTEEYIVNNLSVETLPTKLFESLEKHAPIGTKIIGIDNIDAEELNSITTINSDNTRTLHIFNEPIKYIEPSTNEIKFIDNSIKQVNNVFTPLTQKFAFTNTANNIEINMPSSISDGVSMCTSTLNFNIYPNSTESSIGHKKNFVFQNESQEVVEYPNIFGDGIHLQYVPINSGIKENIILTKYSGENTFEFIVEIKNFKPLYNNGESIPFIDPITNEIEFIIGQVDARDSYLGEDTDGHFTIYNYLSIEEISSDKYLLTVSVDPDFLAAETTVYPVVVDPIITVSNSNISDTSVYSGKPDNTTFYTSAYNPVGYHGSAYGTGMAYSQINNIQNYKYIFAENIYFAGYNVYEGSGKTDSVNIQISGASSSWSQETISYNNKPSLVNATDTITISSSGWYEFDITSLVQNWIKNSQGNGGYSQNRGFVLKATDSNAPSKHFCSANYAGSLTPSVTIYYFSDNQTNIGSLTGYGKVAAGNHQVISFTVPSTATYTFETLQPNAPYGVIKDTELKLYNSNYKMIAEDDDGADTQRFSRINTSLSAGTYYLKVYNFNDDPDNVGCYIILEKNDELVFSYDTYSNLAMDFKKIANYSTTYNCFAYALGYTDRWINPKGSLSNTTAYMESLGYKKVSSATDNCIVAYGTTDNVGHFAKISNGVCTAKLGDGERVQHSSYYVYFDTPASYGSPIAFYVKN